MPHASPTSAPTSASNVISTTAKKVISQTSIRHPNHEIDRTRNQSLETLRAHNPIVSNKPVQYKCTYMSVQDIIRESAGYLPDACRRPTKEADARPTPEPDRDRPGLHPRRAPTGRSVLIHGPTWLSGGSPRPSRHGEFF
ncbi:hypothetical protein Bbelb_310620 [Branchiostoma belcheri]|nr:hypothetical protein Bbelb_310620 [Branchiostoma belcheri]